LTVLDEELSQNPPQQASPTAKEGLGTPIYWHPPWWARVSKPEAIRQKIRKAPANENMGESSKKKSIRNLKEIWPEKKKSQTI